MKAVGVIINELTSHEKDAAALHKAHGLIITGIELVSGDPGELRIQFESGTLVIIDAGQSCCEHRYMTTSDDVKRVVGQKLVTIEVTNAPDVSDEFGGAHEIQFLNLKTDKDVIQFANHNEHNGYYGGFAMRARWEEKQ